MALLVFLLSLLTAQIVFAQDGCILSASGEDDAASFLTAAQSCATVTVPAGTTLNISTRLEMTCLQDTTIVSCAPFYVFIIRILTRISLKVVEGTIKFFADIDYWSEVYLLVGHDLNGKELMMVTLERIFNPFSRPSHFLGTRRHEHCSYGRRNSRWQRTGEGLLGLLRALLICLSRPGTMLSECHKPLEMDKR